jgi:hypothetical protein
MVELTRDLAGLFACPSNNRMQKDDTARHSLQASETLCHSTITDKRIQSLSANEPGYHKPSLPGDFYHHHDIALINSRFYILGTVVLYREHTRIMSFTGLMLTAA